MGVLLWTLRVKRIWTLRVKGLWTLRVKGLWTLRVKRIQAFAQLASRRLAL